MRTYRTQKPVVALDDFSTSIKQKESASTVSALGLALAQTFVTYQSALLITNETANRNAFERSACNFAVDLGGRDKFGKNGRAEAEEVKN